MPKAKLNDIDLYYEQSGSGPPLLLIAGLGYGLWYWRYLIPLLAADFRVICFDNRGAGRSSKPPGPYSAKLLAADAAALLDHLNITAATVVGHSMGGFVAQELALSYPSLVGRLVLASSNFGGPNHVPISAEVLALMTDRTADPFALIARGIELATAPGFSERRPQLVEELTQYRLSNPVPPSAYHAQLQIGLQLLSPALAFEQRLPQLDVPTLILFGKHDRVIPYANAALLAEAIPNSTLVSFPDCGHLIGFEQPEATAAAIIKWHDGLPTKPQ